MIMSGSDKGSGKFLLWLLAAYAVLFIILAINPVDRATWFVENLTVWIILAVIIILYLNKIIFSKTAYSLMFVLIYLHTIGGHWTFAMVPFDWITRLFHFSRNHFDRVAHFSVGFYAFAIAELLWEKRLVKNRFLLFTYPVFCIATVAMTYELVEWIYADLSDPAAGAAYLGSQGDIWDAQKDMLADTLGALTAVILYFIIRKPVFEKKEV
jgi:putative membrane protein